MADEQEIILTTCPRDCYDSCGIAVLRRDGAIAKVRGDPKHPISRGQLCAKCSIAYNGVFLDAEARLKSPLKRAGAKGEGQFEPISWDEALGAVASRLKAILASDGPEAIVHAHYTGTCSLIATAFPLRFFNRLGALEVEPDTVCNMAGHVALEYTIGTSVEGFDPRTAKDARCIMVWGGNPSAAAPHAHKHWLAEAPGKKIVIDPVRHETAQMAELHLRPFPGSDAALAFSILHVLRREGMIDRDFIARHVIGWEEVEPALEGCTPSWGHAVTGVPPGLIEEAARIYGAGPSLLWLGQGLSRQPMGGNAFRACAMLAALTGNFGKTGTGLYFLNGGAMRGLDEDYVPAPHLRKGPRRAFSQMELAERLEDPKKVQALVCWNINPAASSPEQGRLRGALAREDLFTVVLDLFQTDTADLADIVLPAASFLEFDDLVASYFHVSIGAQAKAQEPTGESLPNQEIFRRLAKAMGYNEPELYENDDSIIEHLLAGTSLKGGFDELKRVGTVYLTAEPIPQFADLEFPTPSGRFEIASARAEADGHPRVPRPHADPHPEDGRLRLLSPASLWQLNDSYGNDRKIGKKLGPARVALHPEDAAARGLEEGGLARLANETGEIVLHVTLSRDVPPGVALSHKGRWPKQEEGRANVNVLNPGRKTDMGESNSVHAVEVTITPVAA